MESRSAASSTVSIHRNGPTKTVVTERPRRQTLWPRKTRELTAHFDEVASLAGAMVWKSNHNQSVASLIMVVITVGGM
jgi:hypothetical protein